MDRIYHGIQLIFESTPTLNTWALYLGSFYLSQKSDFNLLALHHVLSFSGSSMWLYKRNSQFLAVTDLGDFNASPSSTLFCVLQETCTLMVNRTIKENNFRTKKEKYL